MLTLEDFVILTKKERLGGTWKFSINSLTINSTANYVRIKAVEDVIPDNYCLKKFKNYHPKESEGGGVKK